MVETTVPHHTPHRDQQLTWLANALTDQRYQHSLSVEETAVELAYKFQLKAAQIEAVATAARLHDCAKCYSIDALLEYADTHDVGLTESDKKCPQSLHAIIGAHMAEHQWAITNPHILAAIRWHTTGRANMGLVEKLVYIADKIEPVLRDPVYSQPVVAVLDPRRLDSLDEAMLVIMDSTVRGLLAREQWIHPATFDARNHFIQRVGRLPHSPRQRVGVTSPMA